MSTNCAVCNCHAAPDDELIVALKHTVGLASVCPSHAEGIRDGSLRARPFAAEESEVGLELIPAA